MFGFVWFSPEALGQSYPDSTYNPTILGSTWIIGTSHHWVIVTPNLHIGRDKGPVECFDGRLGRRITRGLVNFEIRASGTRNFWGLHGLKALTLRRSFEATLEA